MASGEANVMRDGNAPPQTGRLAFAISRPDDLVAQGRRRDPRHRREVRRQSGHRLIARSRFRCRRRPGRGGFGPQLALSYDSGIGQRAVRIRLEPCAAVDHAQDGQGLPRYGDATDTFVDRPARKTWSRCSRRGPARDRRTITTVGAGITLIRRYRPAHRRAVRAHRALDAHSDGDVHWRSISADNVLSIYRQGRCQSHLRPADPSRIFSWLICETRDDKGNAIVYDYKAEDGADLDLDAGSRAAARPADAASARRTATSSASATATPTTLLDAATRVARAS